MGWFESPNRLYITPWLSSQIPGIVTGYHVRINQVFICASADITLRLSLFLQVWMLSQASLLRHQRRSRNAFEGRLHKAWAQFANRDIDGIGLLRVLWQIKLLLQWCPTSLTTKHGCWWLLIVNLATVALIGGCWAIWAPIHHLM